MTGAHAMQTAVPAAVGRPDGDHEAVQDCPLTGVHAEPAKF